MALHGHNLRRPLGPADIAQMRALDPTSTVREGEIPTALNLDPSSVVRGGEQASSPSGGGIGPLIQMLLKLLDPASAVRPGESSLPGALSADPSSAVRPGEAPLLKRRGR